MAVTDETQRRISQSILTNVIQGRLFTLFGHVARLDDRPSDAKQILTSSPMKSWKSSGATSPNGSQ